MTLTSTLRRAVHVLMDPPDFPTTVAPRTGPGCRCRAVTHALTVRVQEDVSTDLRIARREGRSELADYLAQRLEPCTTRGVTPMDALFEMELPPGAELAPDFKSWVAEVRWAFERAALSGEVFTTYSVARANDLPEPPDTAHHWGLLTMRLHAEGLIRPVGFDAAKRGPSHASSLKTWEGVTARIGSAA